MLTNAFIGKATQPTDEELTAALGPTRTLWDQVVNGLAEDLAVDVQEWTSYSIKAGWSLRLKKRKRNIIYLSPREGTFQVTFILGDKAVEAARTSKLPKRILKVIDEAPKYPEGTGIRLDIDGAPDIAIVKKLAAIKVAH